MLINIRTIAPGKGVDSPRILTTLWPLIALGITIFIPGCTELNDVTLNNKNESSFELSIVHQIYREGTDSSGLSACIAEDGRLLHAPQSAGIYEITSLPKRSILALWYGESLNALACSDDGKVVAWVYLDSVHVQYLPTHAQASRNVVEEHAEGLEIVNNLGKTFVWLMGNDNLSGYMVSFNNVDDTSPAIESFAEFPLEDHVYYNSIAVREDLTYVAGVRGGGLDVWRLGPNKFAGTINCDCVSAGIASNSKTPLAVVPQGQSVQIMNLDTWKVDETHQFDVPEPTPHVLGAETPNINIVAISAFGRYVAVSVDDILLVWDRFTGKEQVLDLGDAPIAYMSFTARGEYLYVLLGASGNEGLIDVVVRVGDA